VSVKVNMNGYEGKWRLAYRCEQHDVYCINFNQTVNGQQTGTYEYSIWAQGCGGATVTFFIVDSNGNKVGVSEELIIQADLGNT